jgi:hypothetical protein
VKPRGEKAVRPEALRAAKLSHVPGLTIAEARKRFAVTKAEIDRARKLPESKPTLAELALAALTKNGTCETGALDELGGVAGWIDHINHDGATADSVRALLAPYETSGMLAFEGETWRFTGEWP